MAQLQYTPFMTRIMDQMGESQRRRQSNEMAKSAYMGDQGAMAQLMGTNPQLGMQMQAGKRQGQQQKLQQSRYAQQDRRLASQDARQGRMDIAAGKAAGLQEGRAVAKEGRAVASAQAGQKAAADANAVRDAEIVTKIFERAAMMPNKKMAKELFETATAKLEAVIGPVGEYTDEAYEQGKAAIKAKKDAAKPTKRNTTKVGPYLIDDDTGDIIFEDTTPEKKGKMSQVEAKAMMYLTRMEGSQKELDDLEKEFPNFSTTNPLEAAKGQTNITASPAYQRYMQSAQDWARAKLRFESGAVISEQEAADEAKNYFPQFGDDKTVIAQKVRARKRAEDAIRIVTGDSGVKAKTPTKKDLDKVKSKVAGELSSGVQQVGRFSVEVVK